MTLSVKQKMFIAVALTAWIGYARLIRSEILVVKQTEYIQAAQALGLSLIGDGLADVLRPGGR